MSRLLVFSTIVVLFWPGAVLAQSAPDPAPTQDDDFDRKGIYFGVALAGAAYTEVEDDLEKESLAELGYVIPVDVEVPPGLDARVGYRFHPRLAGEVQFQWFPKADIEFADVKAMKLETLTLTGNAKGYLLTGRVQPFLLVGVGLMHFDAKDKLGLGLRAKGEGFAARFGGGVDVYLNRNFLLALDTSYVLPTGDVDGLDHVSFSLGLQYRF
jgi:opacity protein-like surface antigen